MRTYIKLNMLLGRLVPSEDTLTEEEKAEREVQRIINGEPEDSNFMQTYKFGEFVKRVLYLPTDRIEGFFEGDAGTSIQIGDEDSYLVEETPDQIMELLCKAGVADTIKV